MCTVVIRFMLWKKHDSIGNLGNFRPKLTRGQLDLFKDLYSLLSQGSTIEMALLAPITHRIIFSAYTLKMDVRKKVDSVLEQSLILTVLTPVKGWYLSTLLTTQIFAHIQRIGFSALFHTAWHGGIDVDFVLENRKATDEERDGAGGEGGEIEQGDGDGEAGDDLATEAEEVEDGLELRNFKGQNTVARTAHKEWSLDEFDTSGEGETSHAVDPQAQDADLGIEILEERQDEDPLLRYDSLILLAIPLTAT